MENIRLVYLKRTNTVYQGYVYDKDKKQVFQVSLDFSQGKLKNYKCNCSSKSGNICNHVKRVLEIIQFNRQYSNAKDFKIEKFNELELNQPILNNEISLENFLNKNIKELYQDGVFSLQLRAYTIFYTLKDLQDITNSLEFTQKIFFSFFIPEFLDKSELYFNQDLTEFFNILSIPYETIDKYFYNYLKSKDFNSKNSFIYLQKILSKSKQNVLINNFLKTIYDLGTKKFLEFIYYYDLKQIDINFDLQTMDLEVYKTFISNSIFFSASKINYVLSKTKDNDFNLLYFILNNLKTLEYLPLAQIFDFLLKNDENFNQNKMVEIIINTVNKKTKYVPNNLYKFDLLSLLDEETIDNNLEKLQKAFLGNIQSLKITSTLDELILGIYYYLIPGNKQKIEDLLIKKSFKCLKNLKWLSHETSLMNCFKILVSINSSRLLEIINSRDFYTCNLLPEHIKYLIPILKKNNLLGKLNIYEAK